MSEPAISDDEFEATMAQVSAAMAHAPADRITAALLYLLVQVSTRGGCIHTLYAIGHHLELLAAHKGTNPMLRTTCLQLRDHWLRSIAAAREQAAQGESAAAVVH